MTTDPERIFAKRVLNGMLEASCRALEPAWTTDPVWGTWIRNDPPAMTGREIIEWASNATTEEIEHALQAEVKP